MMEFVPKHKYISVPLLVQQRIVIQNPRHQHQNISILFKIFFQTTCFSFSLHDRIHIPLYRWFTIERTTSFVYPSQKYPFMKISASSNFALYLEIDYEAYWFVLSGADKPCIHAYSFLTILLTCTDIWKQTCLSKFCVIHIFLYLLDLEILNRPIER